ncbi:MAG: Rrf2 family transcriptional regulator [Gemmatimonadota bacterium]|nr:Rrf2 family transcriptional regulator [Gemmatimonadota bacterium]
MQLNDHTDFGLRLLITLGASEPRRWRTKELASAHGLSFNHVQKVVQSLEAAGLVETFRGRGGGVTLARSPETVTVGDVVRSLEPHMHLVRCFRPGESGCALDGGCALKRLLYRARDAFLAELDGVTLQVVIDGTSVASVVGS